MTLTTPTAEFAPTDAAQIEEPDLKTGQGRATEFQPIVLSAQARERLKVLNQVLETAGPESVKHKSENCER